ncbi:MAG: NAD(P)H-hydrate epimerase [Candidatus Nanohaloarchaea archaeon]
MNIPTVTREQMSEVDEVVPGRYGINISRMMENAGYQIADFVRQNFNDRRKIMVYAGTGNNGGDALVAARRLHNWGYRVYVTVAGDLDGIRQEELEILDELGVDIFNANEKVPQPDVALDGLIGYNLDGDLRPPFDRLVEVVNDADDIVSIDNPTGMNVDTGDTATHSVDADYVVTLALPFPALEEIKAEVWVADISIPPRVFRKFDVDAKHIFDQSSLVKMDKEDLDSF